MSQNSPILARMCCAGLVLLTSGAVLHADDAPAGSDTSKMVPVKTGNGTTYIKTTTAPDPLRNLPQPKPTDKYDPQRIFSHTSSLSGKSFSSDAIPVTKSDSELVNKQASFGAKPYGGPMSQAEMTPSNGHYATSGADYGHPDSDLAKKYSTTTNSMSRDQTNPFAVKSPYQSQGATMGDNKTSVYASSMTKQYLGPGAQKLPANIEVKENVVISRLSDLPNRPLTIDEVRTLINHGFKPAEEGPPPGEASKPLNDPNYKPEASPEHSTTPPPSPYGRVLNDDKSSDLLPSPGAISQPPENTEPLPQQH